MTIQLTVDCIDINLNSDNIDSLVKLFQRITLSQHTSDKSSM